MSRSSRSATTVRLESRLAAVSLRVSGLVLRFALIVALARFAEPDTVGNFGLAVALVTYTVFGVGLDFYTFSNRELLSTPVDGWGRLLRSHAWLSFSLYAAAVPVLVAAAALGLVPPTVLPWLIPLVIVEHLSQEAFRLFLVLRKQTLASWILFLRVGAWCPPALLAVLVLDGERGLHAVFAFWLAGGVTALVLAWRGLRGLGLKNLKGRPDRRWVAQGVKIALPLLVGTLALRALGVVDRFAIDMVAGLDVLAAYVLFAGVGSVISAIVDAGLLSFTYPEMMREATSRDRRRLLRMVWRSLIGTLILTSFLGGCALALVPLALQGFPPVYADNLDLLPWVIAGAVLQNLSLVPHYALYALRMDRWIVSSNLIGLIAFACTLLLLVHGGDARSIPAAVATGFGALFLVKGFACARPLSQRPPEG